MQGQAQDRKDKIKHSWSYQSKYNYRSDQNRKQAKAKSRQAHRNTARQYIGKIK